jgi:asparagine synthase (glutamine-hydrolysing)
MCGITGFLKPGIGDADMAVGASMAEAIRYRGPDDQGLWADREAGVLLAHRRLAIVDLSAAGHQPMVSPSGRYVVAFNGEIYNHQGLRLGLRGTPGEPAAWRGHSDTETLLACIEAWGLEAALQSAVGMFALALWDRELRQLTLVRDRLGEKPLYYGWLGRGSQRTFAFGSDLHALRAHPAFDAPISTEAVGLYLRFLYVPAPLSIHTGVYKLEPGCLLTVKLGATGDGWVPHAPSQAVGVQLHRWWSLADVVARTSQQPVVDDQDGIAQVEQALSEAVSLQSSADVPLGAFLSGGVDSSAIVAMMCKHASHRVKTYTIGFDEFGADETPHAEAVARHLGTDHTAHRFSAAEVMALVPEMPSVYSEPFADSSQIPTLMVCKAARQHVTVAVSGERLWQGVSRWPRPLRHGAGAVLQGLPPSFWDVAASPLGMLNRRLANGAAGLGDKVHRMGERLRTVDTEDDLYLSLVTEWRQPAAVVNGPIGRAAETTAERLLGPLPATGLSASPLGMMYRDTMSYLPDDILCKVDRAAMACSLETRAPFLDHRVVEAAWRLPLHMKMRQGEGKWALKQVLYRHVPKALIDRPKAGFGVPVGQWLRGPLKAWADALLDPLEIQRFGLLRADVVQARWRQHLSGRYDHTASLWAVLMLQAWLQEAN